MGASTPTSPLGWLTQLSRRVYLYRPTTTAASPAAPKMILLATWMGAADAHIAKYAQPYRKLYPSSPILLVRSEPADFFWPRSSTAEIRTAASALRSVFPVAATSTSTSTDGSPTPTPQLLIHVWSNGGSTTLARLRATLLRTSDASSFPPYTVVFDSAPGQFHYGATHTAFSLMVKNGWLRRLLSPALHALCSWFWILSTLDKWRRARALQLNGTDKPRGPLEQSAAAHNDPRWLDTEVRRTYVYSDEDALIRSSDVEEHAATAVQTGFLVRYEKFEGTAHVAHARYEPERYWRVAETTWTGAEEEQSNGVAEEKGNGHIGDAKVNGTGGDARTPETVRLEEVVQPAA